MEILPAICLFTAILWMLIGLAVAIGIVRNEFNHRKNRLERPRRDVYTFWSYVFEEDYRPYVSIFSFSIFFLLLCVGWPYSLRIYKKWPSVNTPDQ